MKRYFILAVLVAGVLSAVSCSKDDDENNTKSVVVDFEGDESGESGNDDFRPMLTFSDGKARIIKNCYVNSTAYFVSITELGN